MGTNNMTDGFPTYFMLIYPRTKHILVVKDHERKSARPLQCLSAISKLSGNVKIFVYNLELGSLIVLDIFFFFSLMIFRGVSKGSVGGSADRDSVFCRNPILGFTSSRDFLLLLILVELYLDAFDGQPSEAVSLSCQHILGRNNSLSHIIESLQVLCSKYIVYQAI